MMHAEKWLAQKRVMLKLCNSKIVCSEIITLKIVGTKICCAENRGRLLTGKIDKLFRGHPCLEAVLFRGQTI